MLLNNGDGTFSRLATIPIGGPVYSMLAQDLNGDGKPDLALTTGYNNELVVCYGRGDGTFQNARYRNIDGPISQGLLAADVNAEWIC